MNFLIVSNVIYISVYVQKWKIGINKCRLERFKVK
jgi:hypothetical protein